MNHDITDCQVHGLFKYLPQGPSDGILCSKKSYKAVSFMENALLLKTITHNIAGKPKLESKDKVSFLSLDQLQILKK